MRPKTPKTSFLDELASIWVNSHCGTQHEIEKIGTLTQNGQNGGDLFNQNFRKFRSKTQWIGSVQPEKFRKKRFTF